MSTVSALKGGSKSKEEVVADADRSKPPSTVPLRADSVFLLQEPLGIVDTAPTVLRSEVHLSLRPTCALSWNSGDFRTLIVNSRVGKHVLRASVELGGSKYPCRILPHRMEGSDDSDVVYEIKLPAASRTHGQLSDWPQALHITFDEIVAVPIKYEQWLRLEGVFAVPARVAAALHGLTAPQVITRKTAPLITQTAKASSVAQALLGRAVPLSHRKRGPDGVAFDQTFYFPFEFSGEVSSGTWSERRLGNQDASVWFRGPRAAAGAGAALGRDEENVSVSAGSGGGGRGGGGVFSVSYILSTKMMDALFGLQIELPFTCVDLPLAVILRYGDMDIAFCQGSRESATGGGSRVYVCGAHSTPQQALLVCAAEGLLSVELCYASLPSTVVNLTVRGQGILLSKRARDTITSAHTISSSSEDRAVEGGSVNTKKAGSAAAAASHAVILQDVGAVKDMCLPYVVAASKSASSKARYMALYKSAPRMRYLATGEAVKCPDWDRERGLVMVCVDEELLEDTVSRRGASAAEVGGTMSTSSEGVIPAVDSVDDSCISDARSTSCISDAHSLAAPAEVINNNNNVRATGGYSQDEEITTIDETEDEGVQARLRAMLKR